MSYFPKVKIWNDNTGLMVPTHVSIDGQKLRGVRSIEYRSDVDSIPTVTLEINSLLDSGIDLDNVELRLKFHPSTFEEAVYIIDKEFGLTPRNDLKDFMKQRYGVDID